MKMNKKTFQIIKATFLLFVLIFIDQFTKDLAINHLKGQPSIPIIKDVFELSFVGNKGIAWGMFSGKINFVVIFTSIFTIILTSLIIKTQLRVAFYKNKLDAINSDENENKNENEEEIANIKKRIKNLTFAEYTFIFITAGAIGNLIDRLVLGYVVDFFYFKLIDFPVFNVADIYVTLSMIVFIFLFMFKIEENDFYALFKSTKKWK